MNCANHPETAAAAYCRTCGKPLCSSCTRDVKGVIYCENCLAERLTGVHPVTPVTPGLVTPAPVQSSGPNPAVAGIFAGFFPFGVGAVYTGQYAKGLAHLLIFVGLILGMNHGESVATIAAFTFAFFYVWQIIDAVRTAHALQAGLPAPDPLGLGQAFGAGERTDTSKIPVAAITLIGLGVLFLLQTMGVFEFNADHVAPICLILLGGWLFARRAGLVHVDGMTRRDGCRANFVGPAVLITLGIVWLVDNFRPVGFFGWVGALLLVIGVAKILQRDGTGPLDPGGPPSSAGPTGQGSEDVQPPVSEVRNG